MGFRSATPAPANAGTGSYNPKRCLLRWERQRRQARELVFANGTADTCRKAQAFADSTREDFQMPIFQYSAYRLVVVRCLQLPKQAYQNSQRSVTFQIPYRTVRGQLTLRVIREGTNRMLLSFTFIIHRVAPPPPQQQQQQQEQEQRAQHLPRIGASCMYRRHRNVGFVTTLFRLHEGGDGTKLQVDSSERRLHAKGRLTGRCSIR
ncbi:hypothetical protein SVAN01_05129 [Stagonosporopsis vannaccii]|nr:hypothetical protein SVAN01_05129 [Stagonosporopsis vannaccii]